MGHGSDDPELGSKFYGYDTSKNTELLNNRHMAYKMGDGDVSRYNVDGASGNNFLHYKPTMDRSKMPGGNDFDINTKNLDTTWGLMHRLMSFRPEPSYRPR